MNTLNEIVATSKLEQICMNKDQINREGIKTCYLDIFDDHVTVTITEPGENGIIEEFQFTVPEMEEAVKLTKIHTTVSPVSSAKEGTLLMEQIA